MESELNAFPTLSLRELRRTDLEQAAQILGRGMSNNPVIVRAFATLHANRRCRALERFFHPVLHGLYQRGLIYGAYLDDALVGVCCMARPGFCQPTPMEKLSVVPSMVGNSIDTTLQVLKWVGEWASRDPGRATLASRSHRSRSQLSRSRNWQRDAQSLLCPHGRLWGALIS